MVKITYFGNDNKKHIGWIVVKQLKLGIEIHLLHHDKQSLNTLCFLPDAKLRK